MSVALDICNGYVAAAAAAAAIVPFHLYLASVTCSLKKKTVDEGEGGGGDILTVQVIDDDCNKQIPHGRLFIKLLKRVLISVLIRWECSSHMSMYTLLKKICSTLVGFLVSKIQVRYNSGGFQEGWSSPAPMNRGY